MSSRTAVIILLAAFEQAHANFPLLNIRSQVPVSKPASVFSSRSALRTQATATDADWSVISSQKGRPPVRTYSRSSPGKHASTVIYNVKEPELLVAALNAADYTKRAHGEAHVAPFLGQEMAIPAVRILGYVKPDVEKWLKESGKLKTSEAAEAYEARKAKNKEMDEAQVAEMKAKWEEREAEAKAKAEEEAAAAAEPAEEEAPAEDAPEEEAPAELFAWNLSNTLRVPAAGLMGCFVGGTVIFALFGRRLSNSQKQPLLDGHS